MLQATFGYDHRKPIVCKAGVSINEENAACLNLSNLYKESGFLALDFDAIHRYMPGLGKSFWTLSQMSARTEAEGTNFYTVIPQQDLFRIYGDGTDNTAVTITSAVAIYPGRLAPSPPSPLGHLPPPAASMMMTAGYYLGRMSRHALLDMAECHGELPLYSRGRDWDHDRCHPH